MEYVYRDVRKTVHLNDGTKHDIVVRMPLAAEPKQMTPGHHDMWLEPAGAGVQIAGAPGVYERYLAQGPLTPKEWLQIRGVVK